MPTFIPELNVIVVIDDLQHFYIGTNKSWSNRTRANDIREMKLAISRGIRTIRIYQQDILDSDDWKSKVDEAIKSTEKVVYISSVPGVYDKHIRDMGL